MKNVLVTGIGGSIGCHVLVHLMRHTHWQITGIDSFRHKGLTDRLPDWAVRSPRVRIFTHDLTAPISTIMAKAIGKIDYIINLASISDVDMSLDDPTVAIRSNIEIMLNMLEYIRHEYRYETNPVFLQVSTDEVYGPTNGIDRHKEWDPIVPSNPYSASKAAQESICVAYWRSYGIRLIIVNLMNNFGEMQSGAKFPCIVQRAVRANQTLKIHKFGTGYGSRYYIHSRNSADAFLFLLRNRVPYMHVSGTVDRPDRYNIVGDKQIDNLSMAQTIALAVGKELRYVDDEVKKTRPGHDAHYGIDGAKLAALGWTSPMSFDESMRRTVEWYEENPRWLDPK